MSLASDLASRIGLEVDFDTYLDRFRHTLRSVFHERGNIDEASKQRGLPPFMLREIQSHTPLSVFIPEPYGGRGGHVHECQAVLAAASYESLALSLTIGINGALFLQPLTKYGHEAIKEPVFRRFIEEKQMGGLMITEPDFGTDALSMETSYTETEDGRYHIQGTKHWAGLTGWADFWLVTARRRSGSGRLGRDIDFFVADANAPGQVIEVEERYPNLGLYMIPYGRNKIDITVPATHRFEPESTGIKMMLDVLHRSRIEFPGMGMGFLQRMLDEAIAHCRERFVGRQSLLDYDQVKRRIAGIQAAFTACSAMCANTSETAGIEHNFATEALPANATKAVVTDLMQGAAQSLLQLTGGQGYRLDHIAGRAIVDSRPFQIFEGSNDILYQQISESVLKSMRRAKTAHLGRFLAEHDLTKRAVDHFRDAFAFDVDQSLPQRKLVDLGRILGRVVTMEWIIELGDRGFRSDLVSNALAVFREDVKARLAAYQDTSQPGVVEDYADGSRWLDFVHA
jgi:alkylation response protein AidB-like acyl-CoA dehydrogenase